MKKIITMILTLAIVISSVAVPTNTAKAEVIADNETATTEATKTPTPTVAPTEDPDEEEEEGQEKCDVVIESPSGNFGQGYVYSEGKTIKVTKGFNQVIQMHFYNGPVKWTTDNPEIIGVKTRKINKRKKQQCVVKAKKYGKAKLTATYNGQTTTVTIKVVKNVYTGKLKDMYEFHETDIATGKKVGSGRCGVTLAKFNKKGDLVLKCIQKYTKWTKWGRKNSYRSVTSTENESWITVSIRFGKNLVDYTKKHKGDGKTLSVQHPTRRETVVIPKKYLKVKKINLRDCDYMYLYDGHVSCSEIRKARR